MTTPDRLPLDTQLARSFDLVGERLVQTLTLDEHRYVSSVPLPPDGKADLASWWRAYLTGQEARFDSTPTDHPKLRVAEMFCGAGGLALGFGQLARELGIEWESVGAVDLDSKALAVYGDHNRTHYVTDTSAADLLDFEIEGRGTEAKFIRKPTIIDANWAEHISDAERGNEKLDVLLAGPPCQGHSNLNNATRYDDERNELYLTVPAMAITTGARVVIIENVRGVLHDRSQVVETTETLLKDAGYHVERDVLTATNFGWPQTRERYFLIATLEHEPIRFAWLEPLHRINEQTRSVMWAIQDVIDAPSTFMTRLPEYSAENIRRIDALFDQDLYDLPLSDRPDCHKEGTTYMAAYGRMHPDLPSPTITTGFMTPGRGRFIHPTRRRALNALEGARIQGFPDTYDFRADLAEEPTKAELGTWIGNAVPMPLGYVASLSALGKWRIKFG